MAKTKHNKIALCKKREKIKLIDATRTDDAKMELELIHNDGFIVFAVKDTNWQQWSLKKEDINHNFLQNLLGLELDTYVSMNSFKSPRRLLSNLYGLNALWSDIDYYTIPKYKNKSYEEMIEIISKNSLLKKVPPSLWIYSGNGIYPIWLIQNAHAKSCIALWKKLMDTIHTELIQYGADPKSAEASHVLRQAGSNNTKTGNKSKIIKDIFHVEFKRYILPELASILLPELPYSKQEWLKLKNEKKKNYKKSKKAKEKAKTISLFNIHSLNYARLQDIQSLIELRNGDCTGFRELLLFLYRYWGNCYYKNKDRALEEILTLNNAFTEPLSESEVINATKRAEDASEIWESKINEYFALEDKPTVGKFFHGTGCYVYSNKALIEQLKISYEEMIAKDENGNFILQTIINAKAKVYRKNDREKAKKKLARRNENGVHSREQDKIDKMYIVLECLEKGYKQVQIHKEYSFSKGYISDLIKEIKSKNIIKESLIPSWKIGIEDNQESTMELGRITDTELSLIVV